MVEMYKKISNNRYETYYFVHCMETGLIKDYTIWQLITVNVKRQFQRALKNRKRWINNPNSLYNKIWNSKGH